VKSEPTDEDVWDWPTAAEIRAEEVAEDWLYEMSNP
jgi:hypothetical protein